MAAIRPAGELFFAQKSLVSWPERELPLAFRKRPGNIRRFRGGLTLEFLAFRFRPTGKKGCIRVVGFQAARQPYGLTSDPSDREEKLSPYVATAARCGRSFDHFLFFEQLSLRYG